MNLITRWEKEDWRYADTVSKARWDFYFRWTALILIAVISIGLTLWTSGDYATAGSSIISGGAGFASALVFMAFYYRFLTKNFYTTEQMDVMERYGHFRR
jgi:ABC-type multidrug transport system fused ATPase/permease subunit